MTKGERERKRRKKEIAVPAVEDERKREEGERVFVGAWVVHCYIFQIDKKLIIYMYEKVHLYGPYK